MQVTLEFKYYIILIFVNLINTTKSMLSLKGKARDTQSQISNAQESVALHWPKGIVIYYLDNLTYDDYIAQRIRAAMNALEIASCVKFKPSPTKPDGNMTWIHFTNPQGERNCVHEPVFKKDGEIVLVLGFDCLKEHEILHTLLHAIGFKDEVSHPQRDQYIRVMWNNIQPEYRNLYRIRPSDENTSQLLVEYDPLSVMHFHDRAFSINGQATVTPLVPGLLISPSDDLSQLDKMRLRLLFDHECNKRKVGDMIDTCKMLLSKNESPNDSENETNPKSEEKQTEIDDEEEEDEVEKERKVEEKEDNGEDTTNEEGHISMIDTGDKDDKVNEVDETKLKSTENQNDSSGHQSDNVANKVLTDRYGFGLG